MRKKKNNGFALDLKEKRKKKIRSHPEVTPQSLNIFKGIVSPDWKGLQMISLDRFEV
jgi:hypothetical protein